jgi:hypothetical protein
MEREMTAGRTLVGNDSGGSVLGQRVEISQKPDPSKNREGSGNLSNEISHSALTYWSGILQL